MDHTLNELYNMKHRIEKALQENEYDITKAERKVVEEKEKRQEHLQGLAEVNKWIAVKQKGSDVE